MSQYLKLYFAEDNSEVSGQGDFDNAVEFTLNATEEEQDDVELYAEAEDGYKGTGVEVKPTGTNANKWRLALTEAGLSSASWGAKLELGTVEHGSGGRVNFFVEAKAEDNEDPQIDSSVLLEVSGVVEATS